MDHRRSVGRGHPLRQLTRLHASSLARKQQRRARVSCYASALPTRTPSPSFPLTFVTAAARSAAWIARDVSSLRASAPSAARQVRVLVSGGRKRARTKLRVHLWISAREARGVLVGAFQSEREEETRDRAERGSAVRGSDQASVAPKRTPHADPARCTDRSRAPRKVSVQKTTD